MEAVAFNPNTLCTNILTVFSILFKIIPFLNFKLVHRINLLFTVKKPNFGNMIPVNLEQIFLIVEMYSFMLTFTWFMYAYNLNCTEHV